MFLTLFLLLCAIVLISWFFLPKVTLLVDEPYSKTTVSIQKSSLVFFLLKHGYILNEQTVSLDQDSQDIVDSIDKKSAFVITSPIVSRLLQKDSPAKPDTMGATKWISLGGGGQYFNIVYNLSQYSIAGQKMQNSFQQALVGDKDIAYLQSFFPPDLVFIKGDSEDDKVFAIRVKKALEERKVMYIYAPILDQWAIDLLQDTTLQWIVSSEFAPMIPKGQVSGIIANDLSQVCRDVISGSTENPMLQWKVFNPAKMFGN